MSADPVPYANVLLPILLTVLVFDLLALLVAVAMGWWLYGASLVLAGGLTVVAIRVLKDRR